MGEPALRTGGRPRQIVVEDIVRVGRALGMRRLSLHAVAAELGVSTTALYRHVDGRWGLERLVGESLLSDVRLHDDPAHDTVKHLLSFGLQLRDFILDHPGFAGYLQTLFPRGAGGRRLLADEVTALGRRGYAPEAAIVLGSAVPASRSATPRRRSCRPTVPTGSTRNGGRRPRGCRWTNFSGPRTTPCRR